MGNFVGFIYGAIIVSFLIIGIEMDVGKAIKAKVVGQAIGDAAALAGAYQNHQNVTSVSDGVTTKPSGVPLTSEFILNDDSTLDPSRPSPETKVRETWSKNMANYPSWISKNGTVTPTITRTANAAGVVDNRGIQAEADLSAKTTILKALVSALWGGGDAAEKEITMKIKSKAQIEQPVP